MDTLVANFSRTLGIMPGLGEPPCFWDMYHQCLLTTYKSWDDPPSKGKWSKRLTFELFTHNWGGTHPIVLPSWEHFPGQIAQTLQGARPPSATLPKEIAGLF